MIALPSQKSPACFLYRGAGTQTGHPRERKGVKGTGEVVIIVVSFFVPCHLGPSPSHARAQIPNIIRLRRSILAAIIIIQSSSSLVLFFVVWCLGELYIDLVVGK